MRKTKEYIQGYLDCAANVIPIQMLLAFMHQNDMSYDKLSKATLALYNFDSQTYEHIKPARLEKFTKGLCLDLSEYEKKTICMILGVPTNVFDPPRPYSKGPKA